MGDPNTNHSTFERSGVNLGQVSRICVAELQHESEKKINPSIWSRRLPSLDIQVFRYYVWVQLPCTEIDKRRVA